MDFVPWSACRKRFKEQKLQGSKTPFWHTVVTESVPSNGLGPSGVPWAAPAGGRWGGRGGLCPVFCVPKTIPRKHRKMKYQLATRMPYIKNVAHG